MDNSNKKPPDPPPYSCGLPPGMGWFRHLLLRIIFGFIEADSQQFKVIHDLPENALIVYVNKNKSKFECLCFHFQSILNGLPIPRVAFDYRFYFWQPFGRLMKMVRYKFLSLRDHRPQPNVYTTDFIKNRLLNGGAGFLSLMEKRGFSTRWTGPATDPLEYLLALQRGLDQPIYLIPQLIFFDKKPPNRTQSLIDIFFGSKQNPGHLRRILAVFRKPEDIFIEISEPLQLNSFLHNTAFRNLNDEELAADLRQRLLDQINGHRQRITGPVLKSGEELRQAILTSPNLSRYIQRHAARKNITLAEARREAAGYLNEIAAKYSLSFVAFGAAMMRRLLKTLFDDVNVDLDGLNRVKRKHLKGPLILIPCHKSNFDNLTLMSVLHANNVHCPHTFAGKNLSFWPVGMFIRRTGAFFMRRSFKGAVFYAMVFSEYIKTLLHEGHSIEVFIEGTRSRSGKLLPPQAGGLSILISACQNGACPDLVFVPVSIGYDRIPEEGSYLHEIQGGRKTKEGLGMMIKGITSGNFFRNRYGSIYFRFAEPVTLSALMEQEQLSITDKLKGKELNHFSQTIGQRLLFEVQRASAITPQALVAAALLSITRKNITANQVVEIVDTYLAYLSKKKIIMTDALILNPAGSVTLVLDYYSRRGIIEPIQSMGSRGRFNIPANKRNSLEFYKNNAIGHLVPAAFTALLILAIDVFQFEADHLHADYAFLQELFANEFFFDPDQPAADQIRKTIKLFIHDAIIVPHPTLPDTYNLTSRGFRKLQFFAGLLKSIVEAYGVALHYYCGLSGKCPSKKERIKSMRSVAQHMLKTNQLDRTESISEIYLNQADTTFSKWGFQKPEATEQRKKYTDAIYLYLKYLP